MALEYKRSDNPKSFFFFNVGTHLVLLRCSESPFNVYLCTDIQFPNSRKLDF